MIDRLRWQLAHVLTESAHRETDPGRRRTLLRAAVRVMPRARRRVRS